MKAKRVRTTVMYFYECGGQHFKVWQSACGAWWVDRVDTTGDTVETVGYCGTVAEAECYVEAEAAKQVTN